MSGKESLSERDIITNEYSTACDEVFGIVSEPEPVYGDAPEIIDAGEITEKKKRKLSSKS